MRIAATDMLIICWLTDGGRETDAVERERGCCLLVIPDESCRWRRSKADEGHHGEEGTLALAVGRGGEGGRCWAEDGQELGVNHERGKRGFRREADTDKNMSRG
jgi:hypothetical protein